MERGRQCGDVYSQRHIAAPCIQTAEQCLENSRSRFFISLCTEILQLPFPARATDIDDLILNMLGILIGYGIYVACKSLRR